MRRLILKFRSVLEAFVQSQSILLETHFLSTSNIRVLEVCNLRLSDSTQKIQILNRKFSEKIVTQCQNNCRFFLTIFDA